MVNTDRRERALRALALSRRHHLPLGMTSLMVGLSRDDVLAEVGEGFESYGNDWLATPRDTIPREMDALTEEGPEHLLIRDSRVASRIAQHNNAVRRYLNHGDPSRLFPMEVRIDGRIVRLASDPDTIDRLAAGGEIHLEVYRR